MSEFIWRPEEHAWTRESHVANFMRAHGLHSIAELRAESVRNTAWFWDAALRDIGIEWTRRFAQVSDDSSGFPWTRWFVGGQVNVTHNCLDRQVRDGHGGETALFYEADTGCAEDARRVTFAELSALVDRCAGALRAAGVGAGDSVGLYAPMQVPTVVVLFATMKLGARFVPIFCGYGETALRERLASCEAKILFACGKLTRRGKSIDTAAIARAAAANVPSIGRVVWTDTSDWNAFLDSAAPLTPCAPTAAEDPCLVLYTSGTTGRPKGTVHTHAGCLAQMGKEVRYAEMNPCLSLIGQSAANCQFPPCGLYLLKSSQLTSSFIALYE